MTNKIILTGEIPAKGCYICKNCGTHICLDGYDKCPHCPNCGYTKFYANTRS